MKQNQWLLERSKLFAKYAENMPKNVSYVQVSFDPPKYGWILMHISVNYKEKCILTLSADTDEPFGKIIEWLEYIITYAHRNALTTIDCDPNLVTMYFEPILYWGEYYGHAHRSGNCGLFYIYDTDGNKIVVDTLCDAKSLITGIYNSIINYANEMQQNDDVIENWVLHEDHPEVEELGEDSPELKRLFLNYAKSDVIENYLGI